MQSAVPPGAGAIAKQRLLRGGMVVGRSEERGVRGKGFGCVKKRKEEVNGESGEWRGITVHLLGEWQLIPIKAEKRIIQ